MADLDAIIKPGVSAIVLKVLNEAGAKSLGKCIQIKNFQGNRFTKLVISFGYCVCAWVQERTELIHPQSLK